MQRISILAAFCGVMLLAPLRAQEKKPAANVIVDVSARLIGAAVKRSIDETEPFAEELLGTPVTGLRRSLAQVHAELVPDPLHASLDVVVRGTGYAEGMGKRPHARAYTHTIAPFEARQRILLDAQGLRGYCGPTSASAAIHLVEATDRFGNPDSTEGDFVRCGFPREKRELEEIVAARTSARASRRQQEELIPMICAGDQSFKQALTWARQTGLPLDSLAFSTSSDRIEGQLSLPVAARPTPPPALPARWDLALRVHEAAANELARLTQGGQTEKLSTLLDRLEQRASLFLSDGRKEQDKLIAGKALAKVLAGLKGTQGSVTFAETDPITVKFTPKGLSVDIHLSEIQLEGKTYAGKRAKAAYRIERDERGILLVREGVIDIRESTAARGGAKAERLPIGRQLLLLAMVNEVLKERWRLRELRLPANIANIGALTPSAFQTTDGWLTATWNAGK